MGNGFQPTALAANAVLLPSLCKTILGGGILKTDVDGYWHFYNLRSTDGAGISR